MSFSAGFALSAVSWRAFALALAACDRSWGALGIAFVIGPALNAIAAVSGVVYAIVRRLRDHNFSLGWTVATVIGTAIASTVILREAVCRMQLNGC